MLSFDTYNPKIHNNKQKLLVGEIVKIKKGKGGKLLYDIKLLEEFEKIIIIIDSENSEGNSEIFTYKDLVLVNYMGFIVGKANLKIPNNPPRTP